MKQVKHLSVRRYARIILAALLLLLSSNLYAQKFTEKGYETGPEWDTLKWNDLKNVPWQLIQFGAYYNGEEINDIYPHLEGFTEKYMLANTSDKGLIWVKVKTGKDDMEISFSARIDGKRLYTDSPEEDIKWIDLKGVAYDPETESIIIFTVDNRGTYRYFCNVK